MSSDRSFEYFLADIKPWPLAADDDDSSAATWISAIGDIVIDLGSTQKFMAVEKKTTGKTAIWVKRWRLSRTESERKWYKFVNDFITESYLDRSKAKVTMNEIHQMKQGSNETTTDYMQRMKLTLKLLPVETGQENEPYKISPATEGTVAYLFCKGLRSDHPFKLKDQTPPDTLKATFEAVMKFSNVSQWEDVESAESKVIKRSEAELSIPVRDSVLIGSIQVPGAQFAKFQNDFPKDRINDLAMDELVDMFSAWSLSAVDEQNAAARVARTIRLMNPKSARRVFGATDLARHIIPGPAAVSTATVQRTAFQTMV
ncbi:hypothetical protein BGZ65_008452, partial [Modicella reniformis]